jgi:hypothetical protein
VFDDFMIELGYGGHGSLSDSIAGIFAGLDTLLAAYGLVWWQGTKIPTDRN